MYSDGGLHRCFAGVPGRHRPRLSRVLPPPAPFVPEGGDGGYRLDGTTPAWDGVRGRPGGGGYDGGWHDPSRVGDSVAGWEHQGGQQGSYRRGRGSKRYDAIGQSDTDVAWVVGAVSVPSDIIGVELRTRRIHRCPQLG